LSKKFFFILYARKKAILFLINGNYKMTILYTLMEIGIVRFDEMKK